MSEISPLLPILSFGSTKLNKLELKPNYSIEINSSQSESSSSASTSSTTSIPTESIDPTLINEKFVLQSVLKAKRIAVVCGKFTLPFFLFKLAIIFFFQRNLFFG